MEVLHQRCAGLDVHKATVVSCLRVQEGGRVRREVRRWGTTTAELLALGDWLRQAGCTHVAMEATGIYWKPVWHLLEGELELLLANPAHIRNVPGRKSDVNDATWIADLLAHGLMRASLVPPGPIQELRDLTRTRKQLMREIGQHKQRIQKVLEDANVKLASVVSDVFGESAQCRRNRRLAVGGTARWTADRITRDAGGGTARQGHCASSVFAEPTSGNDRAPGTDGRGFRDTDRGAARPFSHGGRTPAHGSRHQRDGCACNYRRDRP